MAPELLWERIHRAAFFRYSYQTIIRIAAVAAAAVLLLLFVMAIVLRHRAAVRKKAPYDDQEKATSGADAAQDELPTEQSGQKKFLSCPSACVSRQKPKKRLSILPAVIRGQYFHDILKCRRKLTLTFIPHCTGNGGYTFRCCSEAVRLLL